MKRISADTVFAALSRRLDAGSSPRLDAALR
jgi:hypothetical protein